MVFYYINQVFHKMKYKHQILNYLLHLEINQFFLLKHKF